MTCRELIEFLADYLDGQLPAGQRKLFESHLAACGPCRRYLSQYKTTTELVRSLATQSEPQFPPELVKAILEANRK